jgi:hypothetical protein
MRRAGGALAHRFWGGSAAAAPPAYDVLIVGGGVAGALLAALLRCALPALPPLSPARADSPVRMAARRR